MANDEARSLVKSLEWSNGELLALAAVFRSYLRTGLIVKSIAAAAFWGSRANADAKRNGFFRLEVYTHVNVYWMLSMQLEKLYNFIFTNRQYFLLSLPVIWLFCTHTMPIIEDYMVAQPSGRQSFKWLFDF